LGVGPNALSRPLRPPLRACVALLIAACAFAPAQAATSEECRSGEAWDYGMGMCMPAPGDTQRFAVSGRYNVFGVISVLQGPRGVDQFAAPNYLMLDAGKTLGPRQFVNLEVMATTELWTYPRHGYSELLQIGEERDDGTPYVDAQHPHSSPIMGLSLSDTIALGNVQSLELFFSPRGPSTDGPIAYMHRNSARDNPDAPLGHHVGQDVGHISSTVLGARLKLSTWILEASAFNGTEPEPTHVDLPLGPLNSGALRATYARSSEHRLMASWAYVEQADAAYPGTTSETRLSASAYDRFELAGVGRVDNAVIAGSIKRRPSNVPLTSLLEEFALQRGSSDLWGRIEVLQRLGSELQIPVASPVAQDDKHWVSAFTLGYTHWTPRSSWLELGLGASLTMDVIPHDWVSAYGQRAPLTARFIVQLRGSGRSPP
jgi:hypothetical protein